MICIQLQEQAAESQPASCPKKHNTGPFPVALAEKPHSSVYISSGRRDNSPRRHHGVIS